MSEIVRVEDPPMIRFGKHSGKSAAEVMATDPAYVQWALAQPWFQEKNPTLVQFFVTGSVAGLGGNNAAEPAETPEHNALQAKFTQDAYCLAAAAMFSAGQKIRTAADAQQEGEEIAGPALACLVQSFHPTVRERHFEMNAWDVRFEFNGAYSRLDEQVEPGCNCVPLTVPNLTAAPESLDGMELEERRRLSEARLLERADRDSIVKMNDHRRASRFNPLSDSYGWTEARAFEVYTREANHEAECPRASIGYFSAWPLREPYIVLGHTRWFGLELKPSMGDDFPAVLRQVLGYINRPGKRGGPDRAAVVVGEFRSASVPWHLVKKQFWESGVLLVEEAELDALVEQHAHDWGIDLSVPEADFTVSFTDQL